MATINTTKATFRVALIMVEMEGFAPSSKEIDVQLVYKLFSQLKWKVENKDKSAKIKIPDLYYTG